MLSLKVKPNTCRKLIVDVDAGTDDAWALFMLLRAMQCGWCDIVAITCVHGNTSVDNVVRNVLRVLKTFGSDNVIPVYKGCSKPLLTSHKKNDFFHGTDGFSDVQFKDQVDVSIIQDKHAVNAIADLVQEYPNELELVLLGPLTNLALASRMYGNLVLDNVKALHIMGGNYMAIGNITKSAEFNFYTDPEAAEIVLDSFNCLITILPWEPCTPRGLTIPLSWRTDVLGALTNPITELLNALDDFVYVQRKALYFKPCDALLTAVLICPESIVASNKWHASVELHGTHTRGQLALDHLKAKEDNVVIVERVDEEIFKRLLLWTVGHPDQVHQVIIDE